MFSKHSLLNKRPNMKQFNKIGGSFKDDDDDFFSNSFTKSQVDDDNENFNTRGDFRSPFPKVIVTPEQDIKTKAFKPKQAVKETKQSQDAGQLQIPTTNDRKQTKTPPKSKSPSQSQTKSKINKKEEDSLITPLPQASVIVNPLLDSNSDKKQIEDTNISQIVNTEYKAENTNTKPSQLTRNNSQDTIYVISNLIGDQTTQQQIQFKPAYVRRGKNQPQISALEKQLKLYKADERINAINCSNARDINKNYILSKNPEFYGMDNKFVDNQFPANLHQIFQKPDQKDHIITFSRSEFCFQQRKIELISVADPCDIEPGEFKTYGLISFLAGVSEIIPEALCRIFEDQVYCTNGFYYLRLCLNGVWRYIQIDDIFPTKNNSILMGAQSSLDRAKKLQRSAPGYNNELWVSLIEKAVSKTFGSYEDLELSQLSLKNACMIITGAPSYELQLKSDNTEQLDELLIKYQKYLIQLQLASNEYSQVHKFIQQLNAPQKYAYTVIGYDKSKGEIQLRNHWGWFNDPSVSGNSIFSQIGNEGQCTIKLDQVSTYFNVVNVCLYSAGWWSISHGIQQSPNTFSIFSIQIDDEDDTQCYFSLTQKEEGIFRNNLRHNYDYSFVRLFLFDSQDQVIAQNSGQEKTIFIEANLQKGRYRLLVSIDWNKSKKETDYPMETILIYYGANNCTIKQQAYLKNPNLLAKLLSQQAILRGERQNYSESHVNYNENIVEYVWISEEFKFVVIAWQNLSQNIIQYQKKIVNTDSNRSQLIPLCFVNLKDIQNLSQLTTKQIVELRNTNWESASSIDINLIPASSDAIIFRARQCEQKIDKSLLNSISLI